ncbi:hypothetical protein [Halopelagius longus]|uniref:Uncharacterized protein n=1 Tax=Halopelagius longus TaxID=1236180 RepID=A0A370IM54_9EURY|nr:hypothetical protein [Halopelagius longus]RDI71777.1 hypothetical protein DWB78_08580 [Halopelagius longus]
MSLPARLGDELADLFRTALVWAGLLPAVSPIDTVVTAVPSLPAAPGWLSLVAAAVAVGVGELYVPRRVAPPRLGVRPPHVALGHRLHRRCRRVHDARVRGRVVPLAAAYAVCWLCSLGFAVALVSRRVRQKMVVRVDPAARGRSE